MKYNCWYNKKTASHPGLVVKQAPGNFYTSMTARANPTAVTCYYPVHLAANQGEYIVIEQEPKIIAGYIALKGLWAD
jgi:hypothetical protein